jgi:hypothetical protein
MRSLRTSGSPESDDCAHAASALHYDQRAFVERFLARWQARSPAHVSYYDRITAGPDYPMAQALA